MAHSTVDPSANQVGFTRAETRGKARATGGARCATKLLMLRRAHFLFGAACFVVSAACNSPTLPLPPPALPTVTDVANGTVHLSSTKGVEANAIVVLYNRNPTVPLNKRVFGSQADSEGTWEQTIFASPGDVIDVTQEFGSTRSSETSVTISK